MRLIAPAGPRRRRAAGQAAQERCATDLADLPRMYNGDQAPTQEVAALGYRLMICGSTIWLIYK
jgi:plasmid stabilization system protein ParE